MPGSRRVPQGTYVRNTPDAFPNDLAYVGAYNFPSPYAYETFSTFSLYNDDSLGRNFAVYFITSFWNGAAVAFIDQYQGTYGSFVRNASSPRSLTGRQPGQIYLKSTTVGGSPPNPDITDPTAFLGVGFASSGIGQNFPLFIVRPGFSLRCSNDQVSAEAGITFWYSFVRGE
jgi:hypothetical protein